MESNVVVVFRYREKKRYPLLWIVNVFPKEKRTECRQLTIGGRKEIQNFASTRWIIAYHLFQHQAYSWLRRVCSVLSSRAQTTAGIMEWGVCKLLQANIQVKYENARSIFRSALYLHSAISFHSPISRTIRPSYRLRLSVVPFHTVFWSCWHGSVSLRVI